MSKSEQAEATANAMLKERLRELEQEAERPHKFPRVNRLVKSLNFELSMGAIIILNCICIGWQQVYIPGEPGSAGPLAVFEALEHVFTFIFVIEFILRLIANGCRWMLQMWNLADSMLVLSGVLVGWILGPLQVEADALRKLTVFRSLRLIRVARSVRLLPQFKEMWMLVRGVKDSTKVLFWSYVMTAFILYIFAIAGVEMIGYNSAFVDDPMVEEYFGNVPKAMFTLFQVMTLDSWTQVARPIVHERPYLAGFFVFFISIAVFVLSNLITAVIVENAFAISKEDEEEVAIMKERQKDADINELKILFLEIDEDGSGYLSREEFLEAVDNPKIRRKLQLLEVDLDELDELWQILDDGDGTLSANEFSQGLRKMKGLAKSKDILSALKQIRSLEYDLFDLDENTDQLGEEIMALRRRTSTLHQDLAAVYRTTKRMQESIKKGAKTLGIAQ